MSFDSNTLGCVEYKWISGYNGQKAFFIDEEHVVYACGSTIKCLNTKTTEQITYNPFRDSSTSISLLTANQTNHILAFSDTQIPANVHVHEIGISFNTRISLLSNGTTIDYLQIELSNGEALVTLSDIPDLQLIIWNWKTGERLASIDLPQTLGKPLKIGFSPTNWRQVYAAYEHEMYIWHLEQFDQLIKVLKTRHILPFYNFVHDEQGVIQIQDFVSLNHKQIEKQLPNSVVAIVDSKYEDLLSESLEKAQRQRFVSICWTIDDEFYILTDINYVYKYSKAKFNRVFKIDDLECDEKSEISSIHLHRDGLMALFNDGYIRFFDESLQTNSHLRRIIHLNTNHVTNLSFNSSYLTLAISTNHGVYVIDLLNSEKSIDLDRNHLAIDYSYGLTVGCETINPTECFLVLKQNGHLQLWSSSQAKIVHSINLACECSSLATHPYMKLATVGTSSGHLFFIDFTDIRAPRVIRRVRLHKSSIKLLKFNAAGSLLITVGVDNKIFLIDTRLTLKVDDILLDQDQNLMKNFKSKSYDRKFEKSFYLLGYTSYEGEAVSMDTFDVPSSESTNSIITRIGLSLIDAQTIDTAQKYLQDDDYNQLIVHETHAKCANKLVLFEFSLEIFSGDKRKPYSNDKKLNFKDEALNKSVFSSNYLFNGLCFISKSYFLAFVDRALCKFIVPEHDLTKKASKINYVEIMDTIGTHELPYGSIIRSLNGHFVITAGFDGNMAIRYVNDMKQILVAKGHNYKHGGYAMINLNEDFLNFVSIGVDMSVMLMKWRADESPLGKQIRKPALKEDIDTKHINNLSYPFQNDSSDDDLTWLDVKKNEYFQLENTKFESVKKEIQSGLNEVKSKLLELMRVNRQREDIAKLEEPEFYLDLEELDKLQKDADSEIQSIRETKEYENLAKLYLREVIKRECWDRMKIKGKGIEGFSGQLFVENYPLKERSRNDLEALERVLALRKLEISEFKSRKEILGDLNKNNILTELEDDELKDQDSNGNMSSSQTNSSLTQIALKGSLGSQFDGDSPYFFNQFELRSVEQKWMQIILVQDTIYRIKENFNREFEQVMQRKHQEIGKIKEKNARLKQIYIDLNEEKELKEPALSDLQNPEMLFEVKDDEVKMEKYLTPEQKRLLEEQLAEELRRQELERMDNWRDRGLLDMMGGVLQIRKEDELKKDVPVPNFVKEKPQEEWSADEQRQYQVYEQKVRELNEERDKLRKQLNAEANKLLEQIQDCYSNFDNYLLQLHQRKIKTQQALYQEELKIVRLLYQIIISFEVERYESGLGGKLETSRQARKKILDDLAQFRIDMDIFRRDLEDLQIEDKNSDKAFLREFSDVQSSVREQLMKLFKKREKPRLNLTKNSLNPQNVSFLAVNTGNPYAERPSTALQNVLLDNDLDHFLSEADNYANAPTGCDQTVWKRFTTYRREKIKLETKIKVKTMLLNEMNEFYRKRQEEEDRERRRIDEFQLELQNIQEYKAKLLVDLEIQFIIKQGQVEIDPGPNVHNFESCLLINRSVVNSLNQVIEEHGKQKISIMIECKDFKTNNRQLEWEHRKMRMDIEDLLQKQKDITYLKLTREVQEYLSSFDYDDKKIKEIATLEKTIEFQMKQYEKKYHDKSMKLTSEHKYSIKVANVNQKLDERLEDTNVTLFERKHIDEDILSKDIQRVRDERFKEILKRRKLVDLAKIQAQEVAFLRSEVERLRMKTFPALVQIEF